MVELATRNAVVPWLIYGDADQASAVARTENKFQEVLRGLSGSEHASANRVRRIAHLEAISGALLTATDQHFPVVPAAEFDGDEVSASLHGRELTWDVPIPDSGVIVIRVVGPLTKYGWWSLGSSLIRLQALVRMARLDDRVTGVLLIMDTPGGSVAGTADLAAEIALLAKVKHVWVFGQDFLASAGVWIASQADKIFLNSSCIFGSIGTIVMVYDSSKLMEDEGWKTIPIVSPGAELKAAGREGVPFDENAQAEWQSLVDNLNGQFVAGVAAGRNMRTKEIMQLATGQVWVGKAAVATGLVDGIASVDDVLAKLIKVARASKTTGVSASVPGTIEEEIAMTDSPTPTEKKVQPTPVAATTGTGSKEAVVADVPAPVVAVPAPVAAVPAPVAAVPPRTPTGAVAPATAVVSVAATLPELKAAMPKATSDFIIACLEQGSTLQAATAAQLLAQSAEIEQLKAVSKPIEALGVQPVGEQLPTGTAPLAASGDVTNEWNALLAAEKLKTKDSAAAVLAVARANPELRVQMIAAHNERWNRRREV